MSEFRFIAFTDFEYRTNGSTIFKLPITLSTKSTPPSTDEMSDELNVPYMVFEILVAIFAIVGNLMVIIVFQRERKLRRRTNYYIVSLAMADFLVGSLGVPFAILASVGLPEHLYTCLFTVSLLVVLCTISIFCLVAVSVDRYWAILYPMAYSRNVRTRTAIVIISLCWVAGTIVGFLPLFGWHVKPDPNERMTCHFVKVMDYSYLVFLYFATIITPALLMLAFYAHIYRVIVKQVRQIVTMNPVSDCSRRSSTANIQTSSSMRPCHGGTMLRVLGASRKRDVKATQNLSIIVLFFMICWFPLYTINCIKAFCSDCQVHPKLTLFCIILSHLNSAGNPVLYAYHLKDFRLALKNLILKIMGVDVEPPIDPMHRFSLASQHRLQSIDASVRNSLQPRIYIDSPIWLRQQQQQSLKNSQLAPKCGVITPCLNNIHQTVAAVASVPTDIERDMWNIMEASSGAELDDMHYEFPDDRNSNTPPTPATATNQRRASSSLEHERCDSPYSYHNCNYFAGPDESELDDVFLPNRLHTSNSVGSVPGLGENSSAAIACSLRDKLRSDDTDYHSQRHASQSALTDSSYSDYDIPKQSAGHTPPAKGKLLATAVAAQQRKLPNDDSFMGAVRGTGGDSGSQSSSSTSGLSNSAIYVIENDRSPLSPTRKRKFKKAQRLPMNFNKMNAKSISRTCSCTSDGSSPAKESPTTLAANNSNALNVIAAVNGNSNNISCAKNQTHNVGSSNNNSSNSRNYNTFHNRMQQQQLQPPQQQHDKFSPLRAVSQLIFPPIVKHSSLFQLFQPSVSNTESNTSTATTTTTAAAAATAITTCTSTPTTAATTTATASAQHGTSAVAATTLLSSLTTTTTLYTAAISRIGSADESVYTTATDVSYDSLSPPMQPPPASTSTSSSSSPSLPTSQITNSPLATATTTLLTSADN